MALLTSVNQLHNAGTVSVSCNRCHRVVLLDLPAMVARGLGDRPLVELPLWCRACGSRGFGLICLTRHAGGPAGGWRYQARVRPRRVPLLGPEANG